MDNSIKKIKTLFTTYENNPEIISLLTLIIDKELPDRLKLIDETNKHSKEKYELLQREKEIFIQEFLCRNNYFYLDKSDLYFYYDGTNYTVYNQDDISHLILTEINNRTQFHDIKYKIKNEIFYQIKQNSLLYTIPESVTIQSIVLLFRSIFNTNDEIKYFLSVIGDNILQKSANNIQLTSMNAQTFLKEFNRKAYFYLEASSIGSFRFKFHDQDYNSICLINIPKHVQNIDTGVFYKNNLLNIIVVACYFSRRFKSSDLFLTNYASTDLYNYTNYLKINPFEKIVQRFMNNYIESSKEQSISWKNMLYLWKNFLDSNHLPQIVFTNSLKKHMIDNFDFYDTESNTFTNVTSKHTPKIAKFLAFWDTNLRANINETHFEITELQTILKKENYGNYDEDTLTKLITHFYPDVVIEQNKYINGHECILWNKQKEINHVLSLRETFSKPMSIYKSYSLYCDVSTEQGNLVVSKTYYERYIREKYKNKITNNVIYFC